MISEKRRWSDGGRFPACFGYPKRLKISEKRFRRTVVFRSRFRSTFRRILGCIWGPTNHLIFKQLRPGGVLWSSVASGMHFWSFGESLGIDFDWFLNLRRSNSIDFGADGGQISATMEVHLMLCNRFRVWKKTCQKHSTSRDLPWWLGRRGADQYICIYIYIYMYIYIYKY